MLLRDVHLVIDVIDAMPADIIDEDDEIDFEVRDDDDDDFDCVDDELDDADIIDEIDEIQYIEMDENDDALLEVVHHDELYEVDDDVLIIEIDEDDEMHNDIYDNDEIDEALFFETDEGDEVDVVMQTDDGDEIQYFETDEAVIVIIADAEWYDIHHDDEHTIRDSLLKIFAMPETFVDTEMHHADEVDEQGELKYIWYIKHFHQLVQ